MVRRWDAHLGPGAGPGPPGLSPRVPRAWPVPLRCALCDSGQARASLWAQGPVWKGNSGSSTGGLGTTQEHTSFWPQGQFPVLTPQGPRTVEPRSSEWGRDISRPHRSWVSPLCEPVFRGSARGCAQCSLAHAGDSMGPCRLSQWPWTTDLSQPSQPEGSTVDWVLSRAIPHTAPGDLTVANLVADPPGAACTACVAGCGSPGMRPRPGVLSVGGPVPSSWAITCFSHAALLLVGTADSNQVCEHTLVPPVAIFSGT